MPEESEYIDYLVRILKLDEHTIRELFSADLINTEYLDDDEDFKEWMSDRYSDNAYEAYKECCDYASDPLGYYGLSASDFFRG